MVNELKTAAAPAALTTVFQELLPAKSYLLLIKGFYNTDSRISFTDLVLLNASQYNVNRAVTLVSSNKVEYPFDNSYSLTASGQLQLQRSGGGTMDIFVKVIKEM